MEFQEHYYTKTVDFQMNKAYQIFVYSKIAYHNRNEMNNNNKNL